MNLRAETATLADLDDVARLFAQYLTFYERDHAPETVREFVGERLRSGDSIILVARAETGIVAFTQVYPTLSSLDLTPAWILNDLFVDPAVRRSGAGRLLIRAVCERAETAGVSYVALETAHTNHVAQALYEQEGFELDTEFRVYTRAVARPR